MLPTKRKSIPVNPRQSPGCMPLLINVATGVRVGWAGGWLSHRALGLEMQSYWMDTTEIIRDILLRRDADIARS
jgi:hypothetical protein